MSARTVERAEGFLASAVALSPSIHSERAESFLAAAGKPAPLHGKRAEGFLAAAGKPAPFHGERVEDYFLTLVEYGAGVLRKPNGRTTGPGSSGTLAKKDKWEPP